MLKIALALTFVLAASSAWADEMCPRSAQYQAYVALQQDNAATSETVAAAEAAEPEATTIETAAVTE